jgi:hypothetical protein
LLRHYSEGPHTVRFRYLVSRGNNRRLTVSARSDGAPGRKQSAAVLFPEPYRFDSQVGRSRLTERETDASACMRRLPGPRWLTL